MTDAQATGTFSKILVCAVATSVLSCSSHEIDTFDKFCEGIIGVNLQKKYQPFWSAVFSVSYNGEAIRDDYVKFLNSSYMKDVEGRTDRMVWRDRAVLHLKNIFSFFHGDKEAFVNQWRSGMQRAPRSELTNDGDKCLFGTAVQLFDQVSIHTLTSKAGLALDTDAVTTIATDRRKHFSWVPE